MFGLIALYFVWKYLAELAFQHNRSRWGVGLLGIAVYISPQLLFGFAAGFILILSDIEISGGMEIMLTIGGIAAGILSVYLLHHFLKKSWSTAGMAAGNTQLLDDLS